MNNQALRDKLFHALRGELWPGNPELDQMALADVDAIMPIIEQHWEAEKLAWAEILETESVLCDIKTRNALQSTRQIV